MTKSDDLIHKKYKELTDLIKSPAMEAIKREQERIKDLYGSSAIDIAQSEIERLRHLFTSPAVEAIKREQERIKDLYGSSAIDVAQGEIEKFQFLFRSPALEAIQKERERIQDLFKQSSIDAIQQYKYNFPTIPGLNIIAEIFNKESVYPEVLSRIEKSFSLSLLRKLEKDNISLDDTLEIVQNSFNEKVGNIPSSFINFEGMIQLLVAFLLFIYANSLSSESEKRLIEKLEQVQVQVMQQIEQLKPVGEIATYYIVERTVHLHTKNNTKSPVIMTLYPNQRVELIQRQRKWIYIRYFDYLDGVPRMGWVFKNYLKIKR
jgi:hypothetical protein